jgi:RNA polymerase sigma-70 factor, ECF subfamily
MIMMLSDPAVFAAVYEEHARGVLQTALRVLGSRCLAQDVVQDVFLRVWRHPEKFDPQRGEIGAYLRLMARSRALDLWRERQAAGRASDRLQAAVVPEPRAEARPAEVAERESEGRELRAALGELPPSQREAVVLAYWGGLTADEIAWRSGVPLGTAKSRVRLGLARLRAQFAEPLAA